MVLKAFALLFSVVALIACTSGGEGINVVDNKPPKTGTKLYKMYCQSCHGKNGNARRSGAADLSASAMSVDEIKQTILYGNDKGMMAYKPILKNEQELDSLVVKVQSFRAE